MSAMKEILATALALFAHAAMGDKFNFWCGKPYNATAPQFGGFNMGWPDSSYGLPHGQEYHAIKLVQGRLPYLPTDTDTTAVAFVPRGLFDHTGQMNISVSIPDLLASQTIAPEQAVDGVSFPVNASSVQPGRHQFAADISYTKYDNFTVLQEYLTSVVLDFYIAPAPPSNASVVALDTLTQSISVNGGKPFIPIGYYVSNGAMFSGDFAAADAFVKQYASEGYNVMMHAGPITSNQTQMQWTLDLCQKYGLLYQADVTDITGNITALGDFVDQWTGHPAFMSYYIGNEPDGNIGVGSFEPVQSQSAYEYLKFIDPYHPVTLVTNCAHTLPLFAQNVDFIMNDVYSVGIPDHYEGLACNATQGCCGCDLCDGSNPVRAIAERFDGLYADLGVNYPAITFVEQTFFANTSYWSRPPTYAEEFAMAWLSIVAGGSGVLGYTYPVTGVPTTYPQLGLALSDFAAAMMRNQSLAEKTVLSGARVRYGSQNAVYYASWPSGYVVVVNTDYSKSSSVALVVSELGIPADTSTLSSQALGRNVKSNVVRPVHVQNGILVDSIEPLSVKIYFPSQ